MRGSVVVWYAGEIIGASTDTMAEESLKGGCRRLGGMFSAPLRKLSFLPRWWAQQRPIAAPHHGEAVLDQADNSAAQIMRSPGAAHNLLLAEQAFGNFTITMSLQPRVEGADRQNEPPATLARKRERRSGQTTAFDRRPKAMCRPQTNIKISVET